VQEPVPEFVSFGRRYLAPLFVLLLGWVLFIYGGLLLLGRVPTGRLSRYLGGGIGLAAGGLLLWQGCRGL
jgi:hypothetical protein